MSPFSRHLLLSFRHILQFLQLLGSTADRMGSIREGKDADLVLWTTHPLSVEAIADKVFIDGVLQYDRMQDVHLQLRNQNERARILSEMSKAAQTVRNN